MAAPLIGVSIQRSVEPSAFGPRESALQVMDYAESIAAAGGRPVILPATERIPDHVLAGIDGLVLSGGGDLSPTMYGAEAGEETYGVSEIRDAFETALVEDAQARGVPVLAICRGLQLINVLRGGTLRLHIDGHWQAVPSEEPEHEVSVVAGSRLAELVGAEAIPVNSYHHQCIDRLGAGLTAVAHAGDVIEAVEDAQHAILAVQWHPEHMAKTSAQNLALFTDLVRRAAHRRERNQS
ncbi:gamma-glutamyl-gamma-aminobutyrate hydrolase family protein [Leucobacter weissii]|uniref:Gamma-glutamyl-gamma-aminobutyrate hydrolase family protein n=1 Tax=Leucobacter weissii TaxID=1983706 RepID=A0A939S8J3_9MICO|nr:gamma-glutamyl-gamma-aminobutyrate hydrolase family protein [Leucobacter weissii]MBO1902156.1 gamma-glutamyl-gamma-aminobutyrate hydrolase family protein [Leucobacter weissii]